MKREEEIKCPKLVTTYLKRYKKRDDEHPKNKEYDAIEDFKGLRTVGARNAGKVLHGALLPVHLHSLDPLAFRCYRLHREVPRPHLEPSTSTGCSTDRTSAPITAASSTWRRKSTSTGLILWDGACT
jgi:hypothetical protein